MGLLTAMGYLVVFSSLFKHGSFDSESKSAFLEVQPDSRQHLKGKEFTLRCSVNSKNSTGWIIKRLQGKKKDSGCLRLNGSKSADRPEECIFKDIDSKNNGLYWCESLVENKTSNTVNITVNITANSLQDVEVILINTVHPVREGNSTSDSEEENHSGNLAWVSGLCIILVLLVIVPVVWLLFPGFREKVHACANGAYRREREQQEMPKTKQDVTEIQWDLPWMEMDNLLDRQQNTGR